MVNKIFLTASFTEIWIGSYKFIVDSNALTVEPTQTNVTSHPIVLLALTSDGTHTALTYLTSAVRLFPAVNIRSQHFCAELPRLVRRSESTLRPSLTRRLNCNGAGCELSSATFL